MAVAAVLTCYKGGTFGYLLVLLAITAGPYYWFVHFSLGQFLGEVYFYLAAATGLLTVALQYVMALLYDPVPPVPYGGMLPGAAFCASKYHHVLPSLEVALVFHYWLLVCTHTLYLGSRVPWTHRARHVAILLFVVGVLVWSENTTLVNALRGVALGVISGALASIFFLVVLVPRIPEISEWLRPFGVWHYPHKLAQYHRDHPEYPRETHVVML